jgi:endoglucanase
MLNRSLFILLILIFPLYASWDEYKERFLLEDGRIIDKKNCDITHSEAIGYSMYLALKNKDLKSFKKIYHWYKKNLLKNSFGLISWKWGQDKSGKWHILDNNNATDGDLWIAYDNLLAYEITQNEKYKKEALVLMNSIKKNLFLKNKAKIYLLPAHYGYENKKSFEINLSYYLFFIFDKFFKIDHDIVWKQLKEDGISLLLEARFTPLKLHSDWIKIDKKSAKISLSKNNLFGYDAIRIPLNILMSDIENKDMLLHSYKVYVDGMKKMHLIFGVSNLKKGTVSIYNYAYAHLAIYDQIDYYFYKQNSFIKELEELKRIKKDDYYSYSLYLISTTY